jgi:toxin ParE1/3/4
MRRHRLVFSDASITDILEQAEWYAAQMGQPLAQRWQKAVMTAISHSLTRPATGAPCKFRSLALRDVRRATISGFPKHLLFYRFDEDEVFVLRVVHGARDLERLFS